MSKIDYLTEDTINPPDQQYICVSFFSKNYIKQAIDNNNEYRSEDQKESYSTEDNVFALKFRGAFSTYESACKHAENLRGVDPNHNVYVMESSKWCAFMIDDNDKYVKQTEHANDQLNDMMKKYQENQEKAKLYHEFRKNQLVQKSLEENLDNRRKNIDETNELINDTVDKVEKNKLKEKRETIEEQITKLEEKKKELDEQTKLLEDKLKIGKLSLE